VANDHAVLISAWTADEDVGVGKPGSAEATRNGVGCQGGVPHRVRGVDLDQLFVDVMRELLCRRQSLLRLRPEYGRNAQGRDRNEKTAHRSAPGARGCANVALPRGPRPGLAPRTICDM